MSVKQAVKLCCTGNVQMLLNALKREFDMYRLNADG